MISNTESSCTVPWVLNNKKICASKSDMNSSYWAYKSRITNQQGSMDFLALFYAGGGGALYAPPTLRINLLTGLLIRESSILKFKFQNYVTPKIDLVSEKLSYGPRRPSN